MITPDEDIVERLNEADLRIEHFSVPGGRYRVTHIPTGKTVDGNSRCDALFQLGHAFAADTIIRLRKELEEARDRTLEEAATLVWSYDREFAHWIATAIRALKSNP